jgi:hypothetical protein
MESPSTKVSAFGVGTAVAIFVVWVVRLSLHVEMPHEVEGSIGLVVGFVLAYFVPEQNPPSSAAATVIARLRAQGKL